MEWPIVVTLVGFAINLSLWAFGYGRLMQRVDDLKDQVNRGDVTVLDNRGNIEAKLAAASHTVLPECQQAFTVLTGGMNELKGKMDMMILMLKKDS